MCGSIGHCNSIDCITNMFHLMIGHSEYLVATYFLSDRTLTTSLLFRFLSFVCTHSCLFLPQILCHRCKAQQKQMTDSFIKLSIKWSNQCPISNFLSGVTLVYVFWLCSVAKTEMMLFCLQEKCSSLTEGSFAVIASNSAINPLTWQKISSIIFLFVFFII